MAKTTAHLMLIFKVKKILEILKSPEIRKSCDIHPTDLISYYQNIEFLSVNLENFWRIDYHIKRREIIAVRGQSYVSRLPKY
jgi:hypothetical protein